MPASNEDSPAAKRVGVFLPAETRLGDLAALIYRDTGTTGTARHFV